MTAQQEAIAVAQETLCSVKLGEHFEITDKGLIVKWRPSFTSCEALWETLLTMDKTIQFAIGDAWRIFEEMWGERASQIISDRVGWSLDTIRNYRWVAERVPQDVRRLDRLSFTHHQKVAKHDPREQRRWLNRAADGEEKQGVQQPWTVKHLETAIKTGAEPEVLAHYVLVRCKGEAARDALMKELESRGYQCKATERRGDKEKS